MGKVREVWTTAGSLLGVQAAALHLEIIKGLVLHVCWETAAPLSNLRLPLWSIECLPAAEGLEHKGQASAPRTSGSPGEEGGPVTPPDITVFCTGRGPKGGWKKKENNGKNSEKNRAGI